MKYLHELIIILAIVICLLVFLMFSTLIDFFPWGDNKSYVIWEPLIINFIIPGFIFLGGIRLLIKPKINSVLGMLSFFITAFILSMPSYFGFDLESDLVGRWIGIVGPMAASTILMFDYKVSRRHRLNIS